MTYHPGLYADMTVEKLREKQGLSPTRKEMKAFRERLRAKLDEHEVAVKGDIRDPSNPVNKRCWLWAFLSLALISLALLLAASCKNGIVC